MSFPSHKACFKRVLFVLLPAVIMFVACGTAPIRSYYMLENTAVNSAPSDAPPMCSVALGMNPLEVSPPYDITKIIFRPDPLEVRFYTQSQWVTPPEEMFAKLIAGRIEQAHLFSLVDSSVNVSGPHLSMLVKVYAFEEVDKGKDWQGRLAIQMTLRDEMEDVILWKHRFDVRDTAEKQEVKSVVEVLNRIYNREIDNAVASLEAFLKNGGCRLERPYSEDNDDRDDAPADAREEDEENESVSGTGE